MSIVNEEWRDILGFEGFYQVSSLGRVRSLDRYVHHPAGGKSLMKGQLRVLGLDPKGYWTVRLCNQSEGKSITKKVHRLVAMAFVDGYFEGAHINHKDGCKTNNLPSNLEFITQGENQRHAYAIGLKKKGGVSVLTGEDHLGAKLKASDIPVIRERHSSGDSIKAIAADYGVTPSNIICIVKRKSWSHIP